MTLTTVPAQIDRDHWGRPLVLPPGGKKKVPYTRCTTYVGVLEDMYNLQKWYQRMVILGLVDRPDLLLSAAAHREDKNMLNRVAEDAVEAAKAHAPATIGTAIHALTHRMERGEDIGAVPGDYQRDLDAYRAATAKLTTLHAETFCVHDELRIGGTPDRIVRFEDQNYIGDIKTGSIEWGSGKIAMQLAVYAHCQFYDAATGARTPLPAVSGQRGIIIHLPAGTGTCTLHWVDIARGWEAVQLATEVRAWRAQRGLLEPLTAPTPGDSVADAFILANIAQAATRADLEALWATHRGEWTAQYTAATKARLAQLNAVA